MAQALRHRHRCDAYNAFLTTPFALDGQILDLRSWQQPQHGVLAAGRTQKASLIWFIVFSCLFFLQLFSPRSPFLRHRKDQTKKPAPLPHKRYMAQALRRRRIFKIYPTFSVPVRVWDASGQLLLSWNYCLIRTSLLRIWEKPILCSAALPDNIIRIMLWNNVATYYFQF